MSALIVAESLGLALPSQQQDDQESKNWLLQAWQSVTDHGHRESVQVLSDISFEAQTGDRIGIMGLNGAGKTTLLRVLNGVFPPTSGRLRVHGRVQSLLNTSLGFNPYATVRENIYLRGTAMGLSYREIGQQVDSILDFSGLREKSGHRLRTLSSGQNTRLGFAISTAVQPDIMLMDEWIGAGDETFVSKAKERLLGRLHASEIVILASHNADLLRQMCNKGLVLDEGKVIYFGAFAMALQKYRSMVADGRLRDAAGTRANSVLGVVETLELEGGVLKIAGWAAVAGSPAELVDVDLCDHVLVPENLRRIGRADVQEKLDGADHDLGFEISVPLSPAARETGALRAIEVRVSGADVAPVALRIHPEALARLDGSQ